MPNQSKTFTVPQAVRDAAKRGLELRRKYGRGGLDAKQAKEEGVGSGVQRASNLIQGRVSYATVKRMLAFFRRHEKNKNSKMPNGEPGAGRIAWLLWGSDPGYSWARRIVRQEENVEKGSFLAAALFGDDFPDDDPVVDESDSMEEAQPVNTFSDMLKAVRRKKDFMDISGRKRIEAEPDEETDVEPDEVKPAPVPKDAIPAEDEPLTDKELEDALEEFGVEKGVIDIDLVGGDDDDERNLPDTEPAPPVPPPEPDFDPQLQLAVPDFVPNVIVSPYDHVRIRKVAKKGRNIHGVDRVAKRQGYYIMRGQWANVDLDLVQGYLSFIDDPQMRKNALAVGGQMMLDVIEKAEPKVPEKYLEGLTGEERAKRKREIQRRIKGKDRGEKYGDIPGDKDAKTKPSKYSKTAFASKVREEVKKPGKSEFLRAAAKVSGISRAILEEVYDRGAEAWATSGRRPGASQEAWARARIYSFCTGGKTRRTADADLWRKHKASH